MPLLQAWQVIPLHDWAREHLFSLQVGFNSRCILRKRAKNSVTKETTLHFDHFFKKGIRRGDSAITALWQWLVQWFPTFSVFWTLLTILLKAVDPFIIQPVNTATYKWSLLENVIICHPLFVLKIMYVS